MQMDPLYIWIAVLINGLIVCGAIGWTEFKKWRAKKAIWIKKINAPSPLTNRDRRDISVDAAVLDNMMKDYRAYKNLARGTVFERVDSIQPDGNLITKEGLEALKNKLEKGLTEKTIEEFDPTKRVIR